MSLPNVLGTDVAAFDDLTLIDHQSGQSVRVRPQPAQGGTAAAQATFVYQPGGTAAGNVYTAELPLQTAMNAVAGPKWLEIDTTFAAASFSRAGWSFDQVTLLGRGVGTTLTLAPGFSFSALNLEIANTLTVNVTTTAIPWTNTTGQFLRLSRNSFVTFAAGASPLFAVASGVSAISAFDGSGFGTANRVGVTVAAGATLIADNYANGSIAANCVSGAGAFSLRSTADVTVFATQTGVTGGYTQTQLSFANTEGYNPATTANWPGSATPASTAAALDDLAANMLFASGAAQNGTGATPTENASVAVANGTATAIPGTAGSAQPATWIQVQLKGDPATYWMPLWTVGT